MAKHVALVAGVVLAIVLSIWAILDNAGERAVREELEKLRAKADQDRTAEAEAVFTRLAERNKELSEQVVELRKRIGKLETQRENRRQAVAPGRAEPWWRGGGPAQIVDLAPQNVPTDVLARELKALRARRRGDLAEKLKKEIDLTPDQMAKIRKIVDDFKPVVDKALFGGRVTRGAGNAFAFTAGGADAESMKKLRDDLKSRIAAVLTDEQKPALDEYVRKHSLPLVGRNTTMTIGGDGNNRVFMRAITIDGNAVDIDRAAPAPAPPGPPPDKPDVF